MNSQITPLIIVNHIYRDNKDYYCIENIALGFSQKKEFYDVIDGDRMIPVLNKKNRSFSTLVIPIKINDIFHDSLDFDVISINFIRQFSGTVCYFEKNSLVQCDYVPSKIIAEFKKMRGFDYADLEFYDQSPITPIKENINDDSSKNNKIDIKNAFESISKKIVGQDEVLKKLIAIVNMNSDLAVSNLSEDEKRISKKVTLLIGKTGTGKTEMLNQLSSYIGIPIVIEDATRFTQAGYVGASVEDMLMDLYISSGGNIKAAENGILVIDEIDKLAFSSNDKGIATKAVQNSLLKIIDGQKIIIRPSSSDGISKNILFDTSRITVILSGAFQEIYDEKNKRNSSIGFNNDFDVKANNTNITKDDIIKYGVSPEFVGRISDVLETKSYSKDDIKNIIINSDISSLKLLKKQLYEIYKINLTYDDEYIDLLTDKVVNSTSGMRGIKEETNRVVSDHLYDALSDNVNNIHLSKEGKVLLRKKKINNKHILTDKA